MKDSVKILKILPGFRSEAPRLNLEGWWLDQWGFKVGEKVAIVVKPGKLTITTAKKYENEKVHRKLLDLTTINPEDVIAQYKDRNDIWRKEVLKVERTGRYYQIMSIPCRLTDLAMGDLIKVDKQFGHLFFSRVAKYGPNQTIQIRLRNAQFIDEELLKVITLRGGKAIRRRTDWITINIPKESVKGDLLSYLHFGVKKGYWEIRGSIINSQEIIRFRNAS